MVMVSGSNHLRHALTACCLLSMLTGCATQPSTGLSEFRSEKAQQSRVDELNTQLALQSNMGRAKASETPAYRVGADDVLQVSVFNVKDLWTETRVDGDGYITLPLIGRTKVGGLTVSEVEQLVATELGKSYVRNPQVTVLVKEYRSRQMTVLGAVKEPKVYSVQRSLNLTDVLAMAGGLDKEAGNTVYIIDQVQDPTTNQPVRRSLVIQIDELMKGNAALNVTLGDSAVVNVPKAGVVYVEGAVEKPGVYPLQGQTTVLKAVTMAGGLAFKAKRSALKVLRSREADQVAAAQVDYDYVKEHPASDIRLTDGDVVLVEDDMLKTSVSGFLGGVKGLIGFGFSLH